jgi:uncharacterized membrane protein
MLKANKKTLIIASIITILPMLIGVFLWNRLPDRMATHFGANNEADGFTSKAFAVFGLPLILVAAEWFGALVTAQDPKKQNISPKMFSLVLWIVPLVSLLGAAVIYSYNLGYQINSTFIAELLMGVIFIIVGNYLPKARQNYTIGIKIPWTLANEENWNRTHRLAGYLWVAGGFLLIILSLTHMVQPGWMLGICLAMALVPFIYSYLLHVKYNL